MSSGESPPGTGALRVRAGPVEEALDGDRDPTGLPAPARAAVGLLTHGDPAIPYGELLRLGEHVPEAQLITLDSFRHVELDADSPGEWLAAGVDLLAISRFATLVLGSQQR